ncbi:MAG: 3-oxoacyl-ACP reductase FabG [Gammaproteobacteria bacterium]|nr:3-oxoacyl-ACP reductase FabG [Gammaproteobacteria bacterium]
MNLNHKVTLVTGASRGIGAAIADTLGRAGALVIGTATSNDGVTAIGDRFNAAGIEGRGALLNVTDMDSIAALLKDLAANEGAPAILVNNAGITRDNLMMRMKAEEWNDVIAANLSSIFHMSKACLRGMVKARFGRIVNIASVVGVTGNPGQANYAAAKAGMIGLGKSLAREVGSRNITVNTVAPGFIETDMTGALTDAQRGALTGEIPLGTLGQPEDIAAAVLFLSSDMGNYISGETLHVNGGMYMP